MKRIGMIAGMALLAVGGIAPALAQQADDIEAPGCPYDATGYEPGDIFNCYCDPSYAEGGAAVWGTGTYSDDSSVCLAARHAGLIGETGGMITVRVLGGCDAYEGSTSNGVISDSWGAWDGSFHFPGVSAPTCEGGLPH